MQFARTGADVSLVARGAHLAAMRAHGLRLLIGGEERVVHQQIDPLVAVVQEMGRLTQAPTPALDTVLALIVQRARTAELAA